MFELLLRCRDDQADILSEALGELDALAVTVEDAAAYSDAEEPLFGEPGMPAPKSAWKSSTLTALFAAQAAAEHAALVLQAQDFYDGAELLSIRALAEQDWVSLSQAQFAPIAIKPDFWIVPSWHQAPEAAKKIIRLDPGQAFGTGAHPTTKMCLRWIAQHGQGGQKVLDYGCGSGILAIASALYGASEVDAVDIDPAAVQASLANCATNNVQVRVGEVAMLQPAKGAKAPRYDLVLANILASPLRVLAPLLSSYVAANGHLLLAGLLQRQSDELQQIYAPYIHLAEVDSEDGWVLLHGQRAAA